MPHMFSCLGRGGLKGSQYIAITFFVSCEASILMRKPRVAKARIEQEFSLSETFV